MIFVLLIFELTIVFAVVYAQNGDVFSPSAIFAEVFMISTFCAALNCKKWDIQYSAKAFILILTGIICYVLVDSAIANHRRTLRLYSYNKKYLFESDKIAEISIESWKVWIFVTLQVVILAWQWQEIVRIASFGSFFNGSILYNYRMITSYSNTLSQDVGVPFILGQLLKLSTAGAYIFMLFYCYNVVLIRKKYIKYIHYLVSSVLFVVQNLMGAARSDLLHLFTFTVVVIMVLQQYKHNWNYKVSLKSLFKITIIVIVALVLFYQLSSIVARNDSSKAIFDYLSMYVGGSIQLFDQYVQDVKIPNEVWGAECFANVYRFLWKLKLIDSYPIVHLEVRSLNANMTGNVYTFFRRLIQDFGYIGMYVSTASIACIYSIYYNYKIKYKVLNYKQLKRILVYAYCMHLIFMASIEQTIFGYVNNSFINLVIIMYLLMWFLLKVYIKKGGKISIYK